ncbi:MAG: putative lipoic acid-binding regulatory protein [Candidatus Latescibacterota bacterium]|jgi:putative lipoic acid-binding regulatory protein
MQMLEGRPDIDYPCPWNFKVIGRDEAEMRQAIGDIVGDKAYTITLSNHSANGTYCSLNLHMTVINEPHRIYIYIALTEHDSTKIVL